MKKIRRWLPLLMAAVLFLAPALEARAETVNVAVGATSATVMMTVKNVQSFEGAFSCPDGFTIQSVTATCTPEALCQVTTAGIIMAGYGDAVTTVITFQVGIGTDVKKGSYSISLEDGTATGKNGVYPKSVSAKATIKVTSSSSSSDDVDDDDDDDDDDDTATTTTSSSTATSSSDKSNASSATEDADTLTAAETEEEAPEEEEALEEADDGLELASLDNGEKKAGSGLKFPWWLRPLLYGLVGLLLFALGYYLWRRHRDRKQEPDYEGAPMVDYDIGEDDQ